MSISSFGAVLGNSFRMGADFNYVLGARFLCSAAIYAILPYAIVIYPEHLGFSAATVAALIGGTLVAARFFAVPLGGQIDRRGPRSSLLAALLVLIGSGLFFSLRPNMLSAAVQIVCVCLGSAVFNVGFRVFTMKTVRSRELTSAFAALASANNVGVVVGPVSSFLFVDAGAPFGVGVTSACLAALATILICLVQSAEDRVRPNGEADARQEGTFSLSSIQRMVIYINLTLSWVYIQALVIALSDISDKKFGSVKAATLFFVVQAATVIPLLPLAGGILNRAKTSNQMAIFHFGCLLIPLSIVPFALVSGGHAALAAVVLALLVTIGEALSIPTLDTLIARSVPHERRGRAFGHVASAQAIGMAIGTGFSSLVTLDPPLLPISEMLLVAGLMGFTMSLVCLLLGKSR